jgi:hypothetical protein
MRAARTKTRRSDAGGDDSVKNLASDVDGRWRLAGEEARPSDPTQAPPRLTAAPEAEADPKPYPLWIRPLACYEQREIKEFDVSRFG